MYRLKQNGAKVLFMDHFSFHTRFIVRCLHIEAFVANSRPILSAGSTQGEIAIYYLDEPVTAAAVSGETKIHGQARFEGGKVIEG